MWTHSLLNVRISPPNFKISPSNVDTFSFKCWNSSLKYWDFSIQSWNFSLKCINFSPKLGCYFSLKCWNTRSNLEISLSNWGNEFQKCANFSLQTSESKFPGRFLSLFVFSVYHSQNVIDFLILPSALKRKKYIKRQSLSNFCCQKKNIVRNNFFQSVS